MAGEAEVLSVPVLVLADARIEIGDVVGAGLGEIHALASEADTAERALEELKRARLDRRHALAAHQRARQFDGVDLRRSHRVGHGRTLPPQPPKEKSAGSAGPTLSRCERGR